MKIKLESPFIIFTSPRICYLYSKVFRMKVMGLSLPPNLIIFRDDTHPMYEQWLRHEKTHHYQNWETLYLIQLIRPFLYLKNRLSGRSNKQAYLLQPAEQEAYANQSNPNYLKQRKPYAFLKYFRSNPVLEVTPDHQVILKEQN